MVVTKFVIERDKRGEYTAPDLSALGPDIRQFVMGGRSHVSRDKSRHIAAGSAGHETIDGPIRALVDLRTLSLRQRVQAPVEDGRRLA